jgi:hypothetical protein
MRAEAQGVWELLHAGDWACANGDDEALARVATALAELITGDLARAAHGVAAWAARDMRVATLRWGAFADELRAHTESTLPV